MIYGAPQLEIVQDTTDLIGIRILVLAQIWQPSTSDPLVALGEKPGAPSVPGGVILVGEQTLPSKGAMKTTWTFQGINGDGKGVTFKDRQHSIDYGFEPGFAQVPIQLIKHFQELLGWTGEQWLYDHQLALQNGCEAVVQRQRPFGGDSRFCRCGFCSPLTGSRAARPLSAVLSA